MSSQVCSRSRASQGIAAVLAVLLLAGCRSGEAIGNDAWLDYDGPFRDVVLKCVRALPSTPSGYPSYAEFTGIDVEVVDDGTPVTRFAVEGSVKLIYQGDDLTYDWGCEVSLRTSILRVGSLWHELRE